MVALALLTGCGPGSPDVGRSTKVANARSPAVPRPTPVAVKRQTCPEWHPPKDGSDHGENTGPPPKIPRAFADIVSVSRTMLTVQGLAGKPACIELSWRDDFDQFALSADKRFLDFSAEGFETSGHILVDRQTGDWVDTGETPVFSDDGKMLAAVQMTLSEDGTLEGVGVWRVTPHGIDEVAKITDLPRFGMPVDADNVDWTVERWVGDDCAELSAVPERTSQDKRGRDVTRRQPKEHFRLSHESGKWRLVEARAQSSCSHPRPLH